MPRHVQGLSGGQSDPSLLRRGDEFLLHLPPLAAERIPFLDVRIMLRQRPRKDVAAVALRDEEEIIIRLGIEHRGARRPARVGDRPLGQPRHAVGILAVQDRKSTRLNSSNSCASRMPSYACKNKNNTHTNTYKYKK